MSPEEIEKVARIALTADRWCSSCQNDLFEQLRVAFPEHLSTIDAVWARREELQTLFQAAQAKWWNNPETPEPQVIDL